MPEPKETMHIIMNGKNILTHEDFEKAQAEQQRRREAERATFSEGDEEPKMSPEALALTKKMMGLDK